MSFKTDSERANIKAAIAILFMIPILAHDTHYDCAKTA
jgi:hypothetical protein